MNVHEVNKNRGSLNMSFYFQEYKQSDVEKVIQKYISTLSSPIDSFLEEHILNSTFYTINYNSEVAGYFAVHSNRYLTQFYLGSSYYNESQEIFKNVLRDHSVQSIMVPTCDELF